MFCLLLDRCTRRQMKPQSVEPYAGLDSIYLLFVSYAYYFNQFAFLTQIIVSCIIM